MPYTRCPDCRKVQQVAPALLQKEVGCMNPRCGKQFKAHEYRLHSGPWSKLVFFAVIAFALYLLVYWVWDNSARIVSTLG